jgi:hypothetical protein
MSNELKLLVEKIKYLKGGWSNEQVAKSINYGRNHLENEMKKAEPSQVIIDLLTKKHAALLSNVLNDDGNRKISLADKVKAHDALLSVLVSEIAALRSSETGEPVRSLILKYYKAAEDAGDSLG